MIIDYDKNNMYSIEKYAQGMIGKRFRDIINVDCVFGSDNSSNKGGLGTLIEKEYFHYEPNSNSGPDFSEAGVELKTSGYIINSKNEYKAKERLVLTMIDYIDVVNDVVFESSHLWNKCRWMLLVFYSYIKGVDRLDFSIDYVKLFTPSNQDLAIIKEDYKKIIHKIRDGKAHELSEADTMYLSASTKSSDASVTRKQPFSDIPAKPRAFSYKPSYMSYVLNTYILGQKPLYESISSGNQTINDFESYILNKIKENRGKSAKELCWEYDIDLEMRQKNLGSMIAFRILGIKGNNAEEFVKAGIVVKTIRLEPNGKIKENMSFPTFEFTSLIDQQWEESDLYLTLSSTKFLFVIFQLNQNREMYLENVQFWNMPNNTLEGEVRTVWERTKFVLQHIKEIKELRNGKTYKSIFPRKAENKVSHVRPHARNADDVYPLPDGRVYPKQCFWLNNSYILSVIKNG